MMIKNTVFIVGLLLLLNGCEQESKSTDGKIFFPSDEPIVNRKPKQYSGIWRNKEGDIIALIYNNKKHTLNFWHRGTLFAADKSKIYKILNLNGAVGISSDLDDDDVGDGELRIDEIVIKSTTNQDTQDDSVKYPLTLTPQNNIDGISTLEVYGGLFDRGSNSRYQLLCKISEKEFELFLQIAKTKGVSSSHICAQLNQIEEKQYDEPIISTSGKQELTEEEVKLFAQTYITYLRHLNFGENLSRFYAPYVNFYDKGKISKQSVLAAKNTELIKGKSDIYYMGREFSDVHFKIKKNKTNVNQVVVEFNYSYDFWNCFVSDSGKATRYLILEKIDNQILIVEERGENKDVAENVIVC